MIPLISTAGGAIPEDVRGEVVFEVKHAGVFDLVNQGQAENGACLVLADVRVGGERAVGPGRRIVKNDALLVAQDVVENGIGQLSRGTLGSGFNQLFQSHANQNEQTAKAA